MYVLQVFLLSIIFLNCKLTQILYIDMQNILIYKRDDNIKIFYYYYFIILYIIVIILLIRFKIKL